MGGRGLASYETHAWGRAQGNSELGESSAQPCPGLLTSCLSTGYYGEGLNAIIVFAACFLPDSSSPDYHYIMENLFL